MPIRLLLSAATKFADLVDEKFPDLVDEKFTDLVDEKFTDLVDEKFADLVDESLKDPARITKSSRRDPHGRRQLTRG
jgi:hypothetical protein